MKYPIRIGILATVFAGLMITSLFPLTVDARIGERRESIERRLFGSGGIVYRDEDIESSRRKGMPYLKYFDYLPSSSDIRIYFKTADGRRPASSELEEKRIAAGWDLHVIYVNGESRIEVYKRSQAITEPELNHLLALHAEGSFWKRLSKEEKAKVVSAFEFDMVRDDGRVRAKKLGGNAIMFFDTEVDTRLAAMNTSDLQEKAPMSVEGF
ncbi:hypothetical protein QEH59_11105 [Coraliomargarita sp. SDUM461004]|uniref:Outer membrane lipoprotein carrier protein LolA n=1 Tax=Thalassobacterium sedimentorum TaxID=3041258 RepID=A0ABU1AMI1_9BACT|nr:hypothetical protein [Coraliomargarita sp. SDUM461004]MDQ8194976.1 hypothetical protein [Coraliomargarita sp. SDUM461004]